jgi:hypothetical protein
MSESIEALRAFAHSKPTEWDAFRREWKAPIKETPTPTPTKKATKKKIVELAPPVEVAQVHEEPTEALPQEEPPTDEEAPEE